MRESEKLAHKTATAPSP